MFARWGHVVTGHRWTTVIVVVMLALIGSGYGLGVFGSLTQGGYEDPNSEAVRASQVIQETEGTTAADIVAIYTVPEGQTVDSPEVGAAVADALGELAADDVNSVFTYWDTQDPALRSDDGLSAVALITLAGEDSTDKQPIYDDIEDTLRVAGVDTALAGITPLESAISEQTKKDLIFAEAISLPVVLVLLVLIFGGVVAASLPVLVGGLAVGSAMGVLHIVAGFTSVSEFAINVASLLGLGMAIDYGLFIVSRYREELADGREVRGAVVRTLSTAGRTVAFSATLLIIALSTLLLFPQPFLTSLAYGGMAAVALAAIMSLTVLPAVLALLGTNIDRLRVRRHTHPHAKRSGGFWPRLANVVMRHPVAIATPIVVGLAVLVSPFLSTTFGLPDERILPEADPARAAIETLNEQFPAFGETGIQVVADSDQPLPEDAVASFAAEVNAVDGITDVVPTSAPSSSVLVLDAQYDGDTYGDTANQAVRDLRDLAAPEGSDVLVGGLTAANVDSLDAIGEQLPLMITILVGATLVLLFFAFGSIVLPIKAVIMAAVSLTATFGALTWIFVDGHGASLLGVTPQPMEIGIIILMAAVVFGLSTDYEVFLLSRIVEAHDHGATTEEAVKIGLTRSGRVITAAALLLIVVTGAFALSGIQMMRFVGVGMIIALTLDATIIRMLLVPALLKLLGSANWWLPGPLRGVQQRFAIRD